MIHADDRIEHYEGLVTETASQIVACGVELEFDDVRQLLRIKAWRALLMFDTQRAAESKHLSHARDRYGRTPRERYVFICVANMRKDIEKRPRRYLASIDDLRDDAAHQGRTAVSETGMRADRFDARYLSTDHEQVYGPVEDEEIKLPSTMTRLERRVIKLRLKGRLLFEIDQELSLSRAQREKVMRSVREKLADWQPATAPEPRSAPMLPLPRAEQRSTPARASQAA